MRAHTLATPLLLPVLLLAASATAAPDAREIMRRVDARDDGDHSVRELEMVLIDRNGNERVRRMRSFSRDVGADEHSLVFFMSPADVQDTGFLTYDYDDPDRDDDQWLYLPALKKTKRIAAGDKSGSFMGSDFSYADMTDRNVDRWDWTLMKETDVRGEPCWQIQGVPNTREEVDETGYTKLVVFVRKDNDVVVRSLAWLEKGSRLKYMDVTRLERIGGIWVPTEIQMTTKQGGETEHRTILRSHDVRFGVEQAEDFFRVRRLEKGL